MKSLTVVNTKQCLRVAKIIEPLKLKEDFYQRTYLNVAVDEETKFRMHFFAVAICHQTHSLFHPKLNIYGWDFIEHVFENLALTNSHLLQPQALIRMGLQEISKCLAENFSHTGNPADCSLDRLTERAGLMLDAARVLTNSFGGEVHRIFDISGNRLVNKKSGLYSLMLIFEAFADPQQKKTTFLIKLLEESNMIKIADPENFIPIMDYHMQRTLLRLGCVEIVDEAYRIIIVGRELLDSDEPVRSTCIEAFKIIAEFSGHRVTKMNDFFWSLGRSCCHETTLCHDHVCSKSPCTFAEIVALDDHSRCVFEAVCPGAHDEAYHRLWQPVVNTHYY